MSKLEVGMNTSSLSLMITHYTAMYTWSKALEKFKEFRTKVEKQLYKTIKTLQSDRGR